MARCSWALLALLGFARVVREAHVPGAVRLPRRAALAAGALAAGSAPLRRAVAEEGLAAVTPAVGLDRAAVEAKLARVPVIAIVNEESSPYFTSGQRGYFYLDPEEALKVWKGLKKTEPAARLQATSLSEIYLDVVRGDKKALGGDLRLRPDRREVVLANRVLQKTVATRLDEEKGEVPVFYSERVVFQNARGNLTFPFFLSKEDLDAAFQRGEGAELPADQVRIATLDGVVDNMRSGAADLAAAEVMVSRRANDALAALKKAEGEGRLGSGLQ